MSFEHEPKGVESPFWTIDEELGELELKERPSGPDLYTVRLKARTQTGSYRPQQELYPLTQAGTQHEITGKAYILVPDITLTVGLFPKPSPTGAIGTVTDSMWQGMRHHDIANVRGLYYEEDRSLGIWEVDAWGRLDEYALGRLWGLFEGFMQARFPQTRRIYTDDAEPFEEAADNREFLYSLGYSGVPGSHRILAKEALRQ